MIKFKLYDKKTGKEVKAPLCYYMSIDDDGTLNVVNGYVACRFVDKIHDIEHYEGDLFNVESLSGTHKLWYNNENHTWYVGEFIYGNCYHELTKIGNIHTLPEQF